jgi:acetylornithine deacetylase
LCEADKDLSWNLVYLASAEEEVSGQSGIESVLSDLPKIDVAIVGEPTNMQPAIAEKGLMVVDAVAYGKAGHAARNEGVNAIYKALEDIVWCKNHRFERFSPLLGEVKMSVTVIQAGTQHNVVPDECRYTIDVRSNECYTNQEILDEIARNLQSELKARSTRLNSSHIASEHPLVQKCIDMGKVPFGSPTLSDQALMPFPSLKIGPGDSARSHTADEYIKISEIRDGIADYLQLIG